jgi:formate-dependent nitrite reductase membrane component NrfD
MFMLLLDLENKLNLYRFYFSFEPTSPMSWGAWILIGIYPGTLAFGIALLAQEEAEAICARLGKFGPKKLAKLRLLPRARQALQPHLATLRTANIVMGIGLGLYTGVLLGTLQARPLWNSTLLGPLFLVSGLSTGAALMMLFPLREGEHDKLRRWDLLAITAELVLLGLFLIDRTTAGEAGLEQATRFFGGDLTAVFWSLVIVAGLVVPMALEIFEKKAGTKPTLAAPALILTGGLALRWIFVFGGQGVIG